MTKEIRRIPYQEFSEHLADIMRLVIEENQPVEVETETGESAILAPAPAKQQDITTAEEERAPSAVDEQNDGTLLQDLQTLREKILARRNGKMIDLDILNQIREEREHELTGLR